MVLVCKYDRRINNNMQGSHHGSPFAGAVARPTEDISADHITPASINVLYAGRCMALVNPLRSSYVAVRVSGLLLAFNAFVFWIDHKFILRSKFIDWRFD